MMTCLLAGAHAHVSPSGKKHYSWLSFIFKIKIIIYYLSYNSTCFSHVSTWENQERMAMLASRAVSLLVDFKLGSDISDLLSAMGLPFHLQGSRRVTELQ